MPGYRWWLLWIFWLGLSLLASDQPLKSLPDLARWLGYTAFFGLALTYWKDDDGGTWVKALCLSGPVLGLGAIFLSPVEIPLTGFLPPYYNYTMFVLAAACVASMRMAAGSAGVLRWVYLSASLFPLAIILAARSRGALVAIAAAAVVAAARRGKLKYIAALALSAASVGALLPVSFYSRFTKSDILGGQVRPQIWLSALRVLGDHPLLGEGPGNFEQGFLRHSFPSALQVRYGFIADRPHSDFLGVLAETGIVGGVFLALALAACARKFRSGSPTRDSSREAAQLAVAAMAGQCLVDNFLHIPALGMLFFSALARAVGGESAPSGKTGSRSFAIIGLSLSLAAILPWRMVETARRDYWRESDPVTRLSLAMRAAGIYPADAGLREMLAKAWLGFKPPNLNNALQELELASRLSPFNALYPAWRAEIMRHGRRWEDVERLAAVALEIEPHCHQARLLRAEAWAETGFKDRARRELMELDSMAASKYHPVLKSGYDRAVLAFNQERRDSLRRALLNGIKKDGP